MDRAAQDTMTIASTIPLPRPRLNLGQSLTPLVLTKTQQTKPKRETPPRAGGVLFNDDKLAVLPDRYRPGFRPIPFLSGNGSKNLNDRIIFPPGHDRSPVQILISQPWSLAAPGLKQIAGQKFRKTRFASSPLPATL